MRIELFNRQRAVAVDLPRLTAVASEMLPKCVCYQGNGVSVLKRLESIEISIISDRAIAALHRQFLHIPGATDVITFEHGEIVISATTAARQAVMEQEPVNRELARYIVHGLLHLNGHLDKNPLDAAKMWRAQERVLQAIWPRN